MEINNTSLHESVASPSALSALSLDPLAPSSPKLVLIQSYTSNPSHRGNHRKSYKGSMWGSGPTGTILDGEMLGCDEK